MTAMLHRELPQNRYLRAVAGDRLPATVGEVFSAAVGVPTSTDLIRTHIDIRDTETGDLGIPFEGDDPAAAQPVGEAAEPKIPAAQLNERYGHLGLTFDEPTRASTAAIIASQKKAEIIRNDIIARGPGGIAGVSIGLGGALLASAVDPVEIASAFVPVFSSARVAGIMARAGRVPGGVAIGAAEGAVGNVLLEPLYAGLSLQQQLDYGMADALLNVGVGGLLGGLGGVARGLTAPRVDLDAPFEFAPGTRPVSEAELPDTIRLARVEKRVEAFRASVAQLAQGKSVDVSPVLPARGSPDGVARHAPGGAARPQSLTEFIAQNGGINDADPTFAGIIAAMDNPNIPFAGRVAKEGAERNLDDWAGLAADEGFIPLRDVRALEDAIREDIAGRRVVRAADVEAQQRIDAGQDVEIEAERFLDDFDMARSELRAVGIVDSEPDEISVVAEIMRRDRVGAEEAFERMAIERADEVAVAETRPERDFSADLDARQDIGDELARSEDLGAELADLDTQVEALRATDGLPDGADDELARVAEFEGQADAYGRTARAAAACMAA